MSNLKESKNKLVQLGFKLLNFQGNKYDKENTVFYKISGNNIDLVISKNMNIIRFLTLEINEIESFEIKDEYINIVMKKGISYKLDEINYEELDQDLLFVLIEMKSSKKISSLVSL